MDWGVILILRNQTHGRSRMCFRVFFILLAALCSCLMNAAFAQQKIPLEVQRVQQKQQLQNAIAKPLPGFTPSLEQAAFAPKSIKNKTPKNPIAIVKLNPVFVIQPGSLKNNIETIAKQFGWQQVVWKAQYDYSWTGHTAIRATSLTNLLKVILKNYPLQAVLYQGNHILVIQPRNFA